MRKLSNWIEAYTAFTNNTEAPEKFHRWTAISTIAGALNRKCWVNIGRFPMQCYGKIGKSEKKVLLTKMLAVQAFQQPDSENDEQAVAAVVIFATQISARCLTKELKLRSCSHGSRKISR